MSSRIIASLLAFVLVSCNHVADQRSANPFVPSPPAAISGAYTMTLTASARCTSLPEFVRRRSYDAVITQDVTLTKGTLTLVGANLWFFCLPGVDFLLSGNIVEVGFGEDGLYERVAPSGALIVVGAGRLVADGPTIAGTLTGTISYSIDPESFSDATNCSADDHRLALVHK